MSAPERLVLRPLQAAAVEAVGRAFRASHKNVLVQAPCGFGKTELATAMLQAANENLKRSAFVCDRKSLIDQTSARFDKYGLAHGIIQSDHPRRQPWARVQLCSIQTIQRRRWPEASLIMADEAHVLPTALRERITKRDCYTVGLTATPFTRGLGKYFDVVVNAATTNELIDLGLLCGFKIYSPSVPDMKGVKVRNGEYDEAETERRVLPIVGDCVAEYINRGEGRKFITFAVSVAHAEELQRQFMAAGIVTHLYTYHQGDAERAASVEEFRKPDSYIRGLISIESLTRGFDVADVGVLVLARPLRSSLSVHIQMIGRVLRTAEGKTEALILDHAGNCRRFWDRVHDFFENGVSQLDDGTRKERPRAKKRDREPYTCPVCKHVHDPKPACPSCGREYPRRIGVTHQAGELRELSAERSSRRTMQAEYSMLLHIADARGYSRGWAYHKFVERFDTDPRRLAKVTKVPTPEFLNWVKSRDIAYSRRRKVAA